MVDRLLDLSVDAEAHIDVRLRQEPILWLTTVSPRARPHAVPVWFAWADPIVTIFSQPDTVKVGHLRANKATSVTLDSAQYGTDIVLGEGRAELASWDDVRASVPAFGAKYGAMLAGQSLDQWLATFSQPIVVTVDRLVAWTKSANGLDYRSLPTKRT